MTLSSRIEGTPTTRTCPEWPPDAKIRYSSRPPVGTYALMARAASSGLKPRDAATSMRLPWAGDAQPCAESENQAIVAEARTANVTGIGLLKLDQSTIFAPPHPRGFLEDLTRSTGYFLNDRMLPRCAGLSQTRWKPGARRRCAAGGASPRAWRRTAPRMTSALRGGFPNRCSGARGRRERGTPSPRRWARRGGGRTGHGAPAPRGSLPGPASPPSAGGGRSSRSA